MRILLTTHQFLPDFSAGTEVITLTVARELARQGHDVRIFTGFPGSPHERLADEKRFDQYAFEGRVVYRFTHAFVPMGDQTNVIEQEHDNHLSAQFFEKACDEFKPDIVHAFHLARLSASVIDVCKKRAIPFVFTATDFWAICPMSQLLLPNGDLCNGPSHNMANCLKHLALVPVETPWRRAFSKLPDAVVSGMAGLIKHNVFPPTPFNAVVKALMKRPGALAKNFNRAGKIIVPSKIMAEMLRRHGIEERLMEYVPYGIDVDHISRRSDKGNGERLRVGYIGTLAAHKGVHVLIEAMRGIETNCKIELTLHGMPGPVPGYAEQLREISTGDVRITWAGSFAHEQVGEILAKMDVVVVPSMWYENTPMVLYEAQAAGCAVVATNLGGMAELIDHGRNGYLFERGDWRNLAKILEDLETDREKVMQFGRAGAIPMSVADHVQQLLVIYGQQLLKNGVGENP